MSENPEILVAVIFFIFICFVLYCTLTDDSGDTYTKKEKQIMKLHKEKKALMIEHIDLLKEKLLRVRGEK